MTDYDKLYADTPDALGAPTPAVMDAIALLPTGPFSVLDVGCGQGRDALPLARAGHRVTAIDPAHSGIAQLQERATAEGLPITAHAVAADAFQTDDRFDVLLCDRVLHMIRDGDARASTLRHLLTLCAPDAYVLIADEPSNMDQLRSTLTDCAAVSDRLVDARNMLLWRLTRR